MTKGVIPVLLLILLLGIGVGVVTGDEITLGITYFPSNSVSANENINIKVMVSNQSGKLVGNQVDFSFDDSTLGFLNPTATNTDSNGEGFTTFTATSKGGIGNLTIMVHYLDGGIEQYKIETSSIQVIPYPDLIIVKTRDLTTDLDKKWVIANGSDKARVSVWAINTTANPDYYIPNLRVDFSLNNTETGTITPVSAVTDGNGRANSVFTTKTKSGTAQITGKVFYSPSSYVTNSTLLFIDHDTPYNYDSPYYPNYKSEVEVGTNTTIAVKMLDRWGNVIENRREVDEGRTPEQVRFSVEGSPSGISDPAAARFWDIENLMENITKSVDETGNVSVILRMDQKPGINYIFINPLLATVPDKYIQITGESVGEPVAIEGWVNPPGEGLNNPWVYTGTNPSDETRKFTLTYKVLDKYGNGLQLKPIDIVILAGAEREDISLTTNSTGHAAFKYGPRSMAIRDVVVTAVPHENLSIEADVKSLDFISTDPVGLVLIANPQTMASLDANTSAYSEIRAKVINEAGDGVAGQNVSFSMGPVTHDESYKPVDLAARFDVDFGTTNQDGYAVGIFMPEKFNKTPPYDPTATGHCDVIATWTNQSGISVSKSIEVSWKNYPYLNVYSSVNPESVNVTDAVNVTIKLIGDGYKMDKKPIDVIICHDRSGSMQKDYPDRMVPAMAAASTFVGNTTAQDRTGLVSFGQNGTSNVGTITDNPPYGPGKDWKWSWWWKVADTSDDAAYAAAHYPANGKTYSDHATVDSPLNSDFTITQSAIEDLVPWGGTPMRLGLYKSIKELEANPNPYAVQAIILISDGDYNFYGDPLARGTPGQTTNPESSPYGTNDQSDPVKREQYWPFNDLTPSEQNLSFYAKSNGIKIFTIAYGTDLSPWGNNTLNYTSTSTGGQHFVAPTGSDLSNIYELIAGQLREEAGVDIELYSDFGTIEVDAQSLVGSDVLEYIASDPTSTYTSKYTSKLKTYEYGWIDHTNNWITENQKLPFTIGTMYLNDIWQATMTFKVLKSGNIHLFNSSIPAIFFSTPEGNQTLPLPDTYLYASLLQTSAPGYGEFNETDFEVTNPSGTIYEWTWQRSYSGDLPLVEQYFISVNGGMSWTQVGQRILTPEEAQTETVGFFMYDIKNMIPAGGGTYTVDFRLTGRAIDAPSPRRVQSQSSFNMSGFYIWLE